MAFHEELMFLTSLCRSRVYFVPDFSHVLDEKRRRTVALEATVGVNAGITEKSL